MKQRWRMQMILIAFLLSAMIIITYWKSFENDFVDWDDYTYVVDNELVRNSTETTIKDIFSTPVSLNYHPLTILSLRLNRNECKTCPEGISAAPFIKWNVFIHILNTLLVFSLIYILSKKKILVSFLVAALFAIHPMHVESVVWVSERKDLLYSFFFLSGLITYIKSQNESNNIKIRYLWLAATLMLFILSCLSKAMAVVFPLVLLLIRFWIYQPGQGNQVKESLKETFSIKNLTPLIPFFIVALVFGILAISINKVNSFGTLHRVQYASYGFIMYIVKFIFPANLAAIYPYPTQTEYAGSNIGTILRIAPFLFIAITGLAVYSLKKTKLFVFGLGFYFITVMMVLQFISVGAAIMADRYSYLAYVGLAFIPAMLIEEQVSKKRIPLFVLSGCFIILMMVLSNKQTVVWRNSETLWNNVIELYPKEETSRSIRGIYYRKRSVRATNARERKLYDEKSLADLKIAISLRTKRADVYESAGCIYGSKGEFNIALQCLDKAIQIKPEKGSAYFNRGLTYGNLNRNEEAINDYSTSLKYQPEKAVEIINNRSNLLLLTGRYKEAISDFDYLLKADRNNFIYYYNRAFAKQQTNDISGAVNDYLKALQLQPGDQMSKAQLQKLLSPGKKSK
jgi:tetratricopeptide (TPR) repeat protein